MMVMVFSCKKDDQGKQNTETAPIVSFYNTDAAVAFPVKVYVDNEYKGLSNAAYMVQHIPDCGKMDLNIKTTAGPHTFALVANDGYYTTGTFSAANNNCLKIPYSGSNFTSINYGTNNGTLSIMIGYLGGNPVDVWIDNNKVGTLQTAAIAYRCGESRPGTVISLTLSPGTHTYKAVETLSTGGTRTWNGSRVVTANACQPLVFGL